jgi:hypothetical protein
MRTFAMTLVTAGNVVGLAVVGSVMIVRVLPAANEPIGPVLIAIGATFIVIFGIVSAVSMLWPSAPRRAGFWLLAAVPGLLLVLLKARELPYDLTHPASTYSFIVAIVVFAAASAMIAGGIAAFRDVRRGRETWTRAGRAGWVITGVIGVFVGAAMTSLLVGSASAGGGGVAEAPTTTGMLTAEKTRFIGTGLTIKNGEVLGLFVINRDGIVHAFDLDSLGIHVQLPPNSTMAFAISPTGPGSLAFYCSVPGHLDAGMEGTIAVE